MRIFFTTPYKGKKAYQSYIDEVVAVCESYGATIISPEKSDMYRSQFTEENIHEFGNRERVHYEFIRQGIAGADAVIFEASYEDFRVGHEATLALMYDKPVLVLSQKEDYSKYIHHDLLVGKKYKDINELKEFTQNFLKSLEGKLGGASYQVVDEVVDLQHSAALSKLRYRALGGEGYFAEWARLASKDPDKTYKMILDKLGNLEIQKPWDVFAKVYNEDTPDSVFLGSTKFVDKVVRNNGVSRVDRIVDAACGTGAISRTLTGLGYKNIIAFDKSRAMLSEAFRLCNHITSVKILEGDIENITLESDIKAIIWLDFSTNFNLTASELLTKITNLVNNLSPGGILTFDIRTVTGWNIDFFRQKVTAYETDNFQRIWVNLPDYAKNTIEFDIFIRVRDKDGKWLPWEREQMIEKMWSLDEAQAVINKVTGVKLIGVYGDDFAKLTPKSNEPGLAYFVLRKNG